MSGPYRPIPRLVAATNEDLLTTPGFLGRLDELLGAGCPAVWLRAGRIGAGRFLAIAGEAVGRCADRGAELWVGDRADVAAAVGADGVQLPERGLPVQAARRVVGEGVRIGRSVHGVGSAADAVGEGADHLVVGTIYPTTTHPGIEPAGPERIRRVAEVVGGDRIPLIAIGGITPERTGEALAAGAHGVASLRALWAAPEPAEAVAAFLEALH